MGCHGGVVVVSVNHQIEHFGGDLDNVTIFSQSGGSMKVTDLMQIPSVKGKGLFHKAIVMSGVSDGKLLSPGRGDGRAIVSALLQELEISTNEVERLETISYHDLAQAYNKVSPKITQKSGYIGSHQSKMISIWVNHF